MKILMTVAGVGMIAYAGYKLTPKLFSAPRVQVTPDTIGTLQSFDGVTGILI